jgi:PAS domain S-box-containing protein
MKTKPDTASDASTLRRRAEARLRKGSLRRSRARDSALSADSERLLHELQVHQLELEMQNADLEEARDRLETQVEKYTDLYDFAPIGYFSLDEHGRILEVNLTGTALLGVERSRLVGEPFRRFVASISQSGFLAFLERVFAGTGKQACELALLKVGGASFWAHLYGTSSVADRGPLRWCRLAVSDITALREAREAQHRLEILSLANQDLRREVARRRVVEKALTSSERKQTRLLKQSRGMEEQLRQLSRRLLRAQEEERKRISRELHDEITQILVGIHVQLANLDREVSLNPAKLQWRITRTQRLVEKSINLVHAFARELRPMLLDHVGLTATLHSFLKDFTRRTGIRARFTSFARVENLSSNRRTVLYRVAQAALTNVERHAQATTVNVQIRELPGAVRLEVIDNGKSFNVMRVLRARRGGRLGLLSMRERVEMIGGTFEVVSAPGTGTTIRAQIPSETGAGAAQSPGQPRRAVAAK